MSFWGSCWRRFPIPASAALLLWGVPGLFHPFHPDFGWGAALVFCGMGVFILLMAISVQQVKASSV